MLRGSRTPSMLDVVISLRSHLRRDFSVEGEIAQILLGGWTESVGVRSRVVDGSGADMGAERGRRRVVVVVVVVAVVVVGCDRARGLEEG